MTETGTDLEGPAWVLDFAESLVAERTDRLTKAMLARGEDPTDSRLWRIRRRQLDALLATGRVLPVNHDGYSSDKGQTARFADFYTARYDDIGSGARALTVETDEPMQIRPLGDRKVIITRA